MTDQQASNFCARRFPFLIDFREKEKFLSGESERTVAFCLPICGLIKDAIDAMRLTVLEELAAQAQMLNISYWMRRLPPFLMLVFRILPGCAIFN